MASNRKNPAWRYGNEIEKDKTKGYKYIQCKFCEKEIRGGIFRLKEHLAGKRGNVAPCPRVEPEVKDEMKKYFDSADKSKRINQLSREDMMDRSTVLNSGFAKGSTIDNETQRMNRGPMDRFLGTAGDDVEELNDMGRSEPKKRKTEKELRDDVCMEIGRFFFDNAIPFNAIDSPSFISMCRAIGRYGIGFKVPSSYELKTNILKKEEENTKSIVDDVKKTWTQTGVSILSDGWKDMRGRQLINILVNNPYGTVFLRSVDVSNVVKDANMIFNLLDGVVEEIGEDLVVQVVTDNASNYKKAGELLMEKRKMLYWIPCAAHCLDLILEKIGELPQHTMALRKAKKVSHFIYNHGWVLALMRKFTKKDLVRPAPTRFATAYLTLQSLYELRDSLEQMFTSPEWRESTWVNKPEGKEVKRIIMRDDNFWSSVSYALKTTRPLVNVLRLADSEKDPGMGFLYGAMDTAKEDIAKNLGDEFGAYSEIWNIIDQKWDFQLHRPLHAAAYFLNPRFQYSENMSTHREIKSGLLSCMTKLIPNFRDKEKACLQITEFREKKGLFGYDVAQSTIHKLRPVNWWIQFGDDTPELRSFAVKVLSLTCSSSACERNWSAFNWIHSKRRNRLATEKLNSLVYIMYNRKLRQKFIRDQSLTDEVDPLLSTGLASDDEWIVGEDEIDGSSACEPSRSRQGRMSTNSTSFHTVKCSPEVFPSTDTPADSIGFKEAGTPPKRQAMTVSPAKTKSSAHGNVSFQHDKPDCWRIGANPQLSLLDLVGDDDSQHDESGAYPTTYETHVSFSVEGLGKVATKTPDNSPPHVNFPLPLNSARRPFASENHRFMLEDLDFGLAEVKQNQNSRTGGCSFKLPVFSRSKMDSFSNHEQSLSAVEEYAEHDGCGRLFFQNTDQISSRFLDENFLDETTNDQSWRSWQRPMSDSSDFLEFGKHTMLDFSLNSPHRLKGWDAMNAGEMDNDVNISVSPSPSSKCQRYPKVGRCADFCDITDQKAWSCIATNDTKESISLPSEESCSSSAVMGESTTDSLLVSTARESIQNHVNVLQRPCQKHGVEIFSKETTMNVPQCKQNLDWLGNHGGMSSDSNSTMSKLVHNTDFGCLNNSRKHENWLFEETCVPADKDLGISYFLQTSGRKFSSWTDDFPVPQQQINAKLSFEKFGNNSTFDCLHNGEKFGNNSTFDCLHNGRSSEEFAYHQSLGCVQSSIFPNFSDIGPELMVSDLGPASGMTGIPSESSPFAAQQKHGEFPAVRGVRKCREKSELSSLPLDYQKFKQDDEIHVGHFDVTKENKKSMDGNIGKIESNGIGNKSVETGDTIPYSEDSLISTKVPHKFGRIINDKEYFFDVKTSLPCQEESKTEEADLSPKVTMLESCVIQLCVQKVLKQTSTWKTLRNA